MANRSADTDTQKSILNILINAQNMKCKDKIAYETRREAYEFAKTVRRGYKRGCAYVYECTFCHKYHVTHIRPERWSHKAQNKKYNFNELAR